MKYFVVTVFCSFLSSGNLQTVDNAFNYQMPPGDNTVLGPVADENNWPIQTYQSFGGNFYGTARRSINPKPCVRQSNLQDASYEQNTHIKRQGNNVQQAPMGQPMNVQQEKITSNTQNVAFQPLMNSQMEKQYTNTQYMTVQQPVNNINPLINQVQEPSPTRRSSLEESEKIESNLDLSNLGTQVIEDEVASSLRSSYSDEGRAGPASTESPESPEISANSDIASSNESLQSSESISEDEATQKTKESMEENSGANFAEEKVFEITPSIVRSNQENYYMSQVTTDVIVTPPTPPPTFLHELSLRYDASNILCKNSAAIIPEAPRRFLGESNNPIIYQKTSTTKEIARSDISQLGASGTGITPAINLGNRINSNSANNQGSTYTSYSSNVIRTNANNPENQENQVRTQNRDSVAPNLLDKSSSKTKPVERSGKVHYVLGDNRNTMYNDPTQGQGISSVKKNSLMLMDYDRICYACSTANNPTCLTPDRKTSVKYCRKGDNACVTKTFGAGSTLTLIRDCARSCADAEVPGLVPQFKSCSICYSDLCNAANSIKVYSLILIMPTIVLIALVKLLL